MNPVEKLVELQSRKKSLLCVGLDIDPRKLPVGLGGSPKGMFTFLSRIIEATSDLVIAYKPNLAFFEVLGADGLSLMRHICERIPDDTLLIADAKRGDIGNTSTYYAHALFKSLNADWVTVSPFMGYDSVKPFMDYRDRGTFVLCLTSNPGSADFQTLDVGGAPLYMRVVEKAREWNSANNLGLVVGATHPDQLGRIRAAAGSMPLLIPGIGAQGGALEKAAVDGTAHFTLPAIINVSRSVLYASEGADYAQAARDNVLKMRQQIDALRPGAVVPSSAPSEPTHVDAEPTGA